MPPPPIRDWYHRRQLFAWLRPLQMPMKNGSDPPRPEPKCVEEFSHKEPTTHCYIIIALYFSKYQGGIPLQMSHSGPFSQGVE